MKQPNKNELLRKIIHKNYNF